VPVLVFGVVLVRVLVSGRLLVLVLVLVLVVVIRVPVLVRVLHAVRMLVRVLVLVRHGSRFGPQAATALPAGRDRTSAAPYAKRGDHADRPTGQKRSQKRCARVRARR
jgi:hypothetical protein